LRSRKGGGESEGKKYGRTADGKGRRRERVGGGERVDGES